MSEALTWGASLATIAILLAYEVGLLLVQRRSPDRVARTAHARMRTEWFDALSRQPGSELLAVQTLRNSVMSASMIASTAAIGLMGTVTLVAPLLAEAWAEAGVPGTRFTPRLVLELLLMVQLFASLACAATSVRCFTHAGFICSMPVNSAERQRWNRVGAVYMKRAGMLYSWSLRHLFMVAPVVVALVHPGWGPLAALAVLAVLRWFDRFG
ncbi:DUF599 domain-containing protein [Caldimonas tepidiphila]|uniref:DUF599 domain-containing protein n=1 Tax=Caldimonas tepidiphila TaxID=2315841 RepID=UPI000E5BC30D|nr:DUF599 domain-containing protein [Caldimonas tepidiphila]